MDIHPAVFIVIGIIVVIGIVILAWYFEKKRREAIAAWARENGWRFRPGKHSDPGHPFSIFDDGHSRWSRYHLSKRVDGAVPGLDRADLELFEYHYAITTHTGKSSSTSHYHFMCALVASGVDLGAITIRREHFFDKIAQAIGFDDIDFEDHEFSKKFMVKAKDRKRAYAVIDRRMMAFLLDNSGWGIETNRDLLFVFTKGKPNPEKLTRLAGFTTEFLKALPRTLVNEERERRGLPPAIDAGSAARHHGNDEGEY